MSCQFHHGVYYNHCVMCYIYDDHYKVQPFNSFIITGYDILLLLHALPIVYRLKMLKCLGVQWYFVITTCNCKLLRLLAMIA